jgi:selenophosphate synthetase-related protein
VIYSHTAEAGDRVVAAIDLDGRVHPSCSLNWDSVTMKSAGAVRAQIRIMETIGKEQLATAGKDISNPGIIGTLGMLLEVSGKGASIELDAVPRPNLAKHGITFEHWVRMYPGMGFILTVKEERMPELVDRFAGVGITAKVIGTVDGSRELTVTYKGGDESRVFDFSHNGIMRLFSPSSSCGCK